MANEQIPLELLSLVPKNITDDMGMRKWLQDNHNWPAPAEPTVRQKLNQYLKPDRGMMPNSTTQAIRG